MACNDERDLQEGHRKGIIIKPADWHRPTREEWEAMRDIVEQAVKKASGHS